MPIHENISIFYKKLGTYNPQMRYGFDNYSSFKDDNKQIGEIYGGKSYHRECLDGSRYPTSVLSFNNVRKGLHPTQKPLELIEYLVKTFTNENDLILDPFMGAGTTGVACKHFNRRFIGIELDSNYFKIAKERIEKE
jgi:site-specific DNA-methyltransferase (adenine-specific)